MKSATETGDPPSTAGVFVIPAERKRRRLPIYNRDGRELELDTDLDRLLDRLQMGNERNEYGPFLFSVIEC